MTRLDAADHRATMDMVQLDLRDRYLKHLGMIGSTVGGEGSSSTWWGTQKAAGSNRVWPAPTRCRR